MKTHPSFTSIAQLRKEKPKRIAPWENYQAYDIFSVPTADLLWKIASKLKKEKILDRYSPQASRWLEDYLLYQETLMKYEKKRYAELERRQKVRQEEVAKLTKRQKKILEIR